MSNENPNDQCAYTVGLEALLEEMRMPVSPRILGESGAIRTQETQQYWANRLEAALPTQQVGSLCECGEKPMQVCSCQSEPAASIEVYYHATDNPEEVLRNGLLQQKSDCNCGCIWLARTATDAAEFGATVIAVNMKGLPGNFPIGDWQAHYNEGDIEPSRLSLFQAASDGASSEEEA